MKTPWETRVYAASCEKGFFGGQMSICELQAIEILGQAGDGIDPIADEGA